MTLSLNLYLILHMKIRSLLILYTSRLNPRLKLLMYSVMTPLYGDSDTKMANGYLSATDNAGLPMYRPAPIRYELTA